MSDVRTIQLHGQDNTAVVISENGAQPGDKGASISFLTDVPKGHKVAIHDIAKGEPVIKFSHIIGLATENIKAGSHVHTHNVTMPPEVQGAGGQNGKIGAQLVASRDISKTDLPTTFQGYKRTHGRAGIRNYILVTATVNCSATVVKAICQYFRSIDLSNKNIDGVIPVTHSAGCAQAMPGLNFSTLNKTLAGWANHPNVVANLFVGLGCEGTTFDTIIKHSTELGYKLTKPERHYRIQDIGGTQAAIAHGIKKIEEIMAVLPQFQRESLPVSEIGLALNCGGSDAFSALTANPALGVAGDILTTLKGTSVLAEIPECHGAEGLLAERAINTKVVDKLHATFSWWLRYADEHKVNLNNNLAPGNIAGGITTIIEKSLGAVSKGGAAPLTDVVEYAEPIPATGFALMNTPGFDPVSVTGLVAGGCNIVCFTTGRGSVYGCSIAPTIKISTNTSLFKKMPDDIDFNAGSIVDGDSVESIGIDLYRYIVKVASGHKTKSEVMKLGWEEFAPWPIGETL